MISWLGNSRSGHGNGEIEMDGVGEAVDVADSVAVVEADCVAVVDAELVRVLLGDRVCPSTPTAHSASATRRYIVAVISSSTSSNTRRGLRA
jgi:hypothetical protein